MDFLNPDTAKLAKLKKPSLLRKQVSCGIFQELQPEKVQYYPKRDEIER